MSDEAKGSGGVRWWWAVAIGLLAITVHLPSLGGEFLNWDDEWLIVSNPYLDDASDLVRLVDPTAWRARLGAEYLPVRDLSLWVDHAIWGPRPFGHHLTCVLLFGLVCVVVLFVLRDLTDSAGAAAVGAVLFALHPIQVESVAWISERKGLLAALFLGLSLLAYRRSRSASRPGWFAAAIGLFVLAALGKSTVHFFALLLPGLEWIRARRSGEAARPWRWAAAAMPFAIVSIVAVALNARHQSDAGAVYGWAGETPARAILVVATVALRSLVHVLFPVGLAADYDVDPGVAGWVAVAIVAGVLALGVGVVIRGGRAACPTLFALLAWLPVSNLVALPNRMADRYFFLVWLGLAGVAGLAAEAGLRGEGRRRRVSLVALILISVGLTALTIQRTAVWRDSETLWRDAVARSPGSARTHQNLGEILLRKGDVDGAFASFGRMLDVEPEQGRWWVYVAGKLQEVGDVTGAERMLREGLIRAPAYPGTRINLAHLLHARAARGDGPPSLLDEAIRLLREVSDGPNSGDVPAHIRAVASYDRGALELSRGRVSAGIALTSHALDLGLSPVDEVLARDNLAKALRMVGRTAEASRHEARRDELVVWLDLDAPALR